MRSREKQRGNFLYGALILALGMAVVKGIGALFKIPLTYTVGEYGMGLFNVAYSFYGPVFSLATAGLPVAVSRLVSESRSLGRWQDVLRYKKTALPLFLALGGIGMALLTGFAPFYCRRVIGTEPAILPMLALAPAILFACGSSVYRGYFAGLQDMAPTALSQIVEALVKLVLGLGLSRWAAAAFRKEYALRGTVLSMRPADAGQAELLTLSVAAAGAILGVTFGSAASLLYLALRSRFRCRIDPALLQCAPPAVGKRTAARRLLRITAPVAMGAAASNAAGLIDATVLQGRLQALLAENPEMLTTRFAGMIPPTYLGNPQSIPTFLYGCYTLAMTVYLLAPALTQTIGVSALPAVTEAWARGDGEALENRICTAAKVTALCCFPAGLGITAVAGPVVEVLYGPGGSAAIVAGVLRILGIAAVFAALSTPLSSMLQAVGRADLPVKLLLAAMALKLLANRFLCGIESIHIYGAAVGTLLCYAFFAAGQWIALRKAAGVRMPLTRLLLGPCVCGCLCALAAGACCQFLENALPAGRLFAALGLGISVLLGAAVYAAGLLFTGALEKDELFLMPGGQKIAKTLEKWGWV